MKKQFVLIATVALMAAMFATSAVAQTAQVKGVVKDKDGKPWPGVNVEFVSLDNGRKQTLTTNAKGEYMSLGFSPGKYKVTLLVNGQPAFSYPQVPVQIGAENEIDIDIQKEMKGAAAQNEAAIKEREKVQKENEKVRGLNKMLTDAAAAQQAGNFDQAIQILSQATQADPNRDLLWFKLGDAYRAGKKYPEAVEAYNKAIAIKPTGAYYNNLGDALGKSGKTPESMAAFQKAAEIDPAGAGQYYFNLGAVLTNTGKVDDAIQAFDKALQIDPNRADAYYWKGVNMIGKATMKGDKMVAPEGTAEAFNKYLELQPTGQYADPAKQMLATIGATVQTSYGTKGKKK